MKKRPLYLDFGGWSYNPEDGWRYQPMPRRDRKVLIAVCTVLMMFIIIVNL